MSGVSRFTPRELAYLAQVDQEIDAKFSITRSEITFGNKLDRLAELERMPPEVQQRHYDHLRRNRKNQERNLQARRDNYQKKKAYYAEYQRAYRQRLKDIAKKSNRRDGD